MHLLASPVVIDKNGERFRPEWIQLCLVSDLEHMRSQVLSSSLVDSTETQKRYERLFELLHLLPQNDGAVGLIGLVQYGAQANFEPTSEFLSDCKNWKPEIHAALNDFLPEFGSVKRSRAAIFLDLFMVSTTIRLLEQYVNVVDNTARIVPHTWENRMVDGEGFVLIDLDSGTYLGGELSEHHSTLRAGRTLFTATVFSEEETAEKWARDFSEYYPNIALAPLKTKIENLRVVQMDAKRHARTDEHLARFSKTLIESEVGVHTTNKIPRKM